MQGFVGRESLVGALREHAEEVARTGRGRLVLLVGEAGVGKSWVSSELASRLSSEGMPSVWSRCWDDGPPLWPWPDVVAELSRQRGTSGTTGIGTGPGDRFERFLHVIDGLREACAGAPAVALIDDLHSAAGEAVLLTTFIARSLHRMPLLVVATWRTESTADDRLEALARESHLLRVEPFDEREVAAYVRCRRGSSASPEEVDALVATTGGVPLYVAEVVRRGSPVDGGVRTGCERLLHHRLAAVEPAARRVIDAAAVLGDGASVGEIAVTSAASPTDVVRAVEANGAVVRCGRGEVRFVHGLLLEAVRSCLDADRRADLHARAAAAIRGTDVRSAVRRAAHLLELATRSDADRDAAVAACLEAARRLQRSWEFDRAAEWADHGRRVAGSSPPAVRAELGLALADAVRAAGRLAEARSWYERAIDPAEEAGDSRLVALAALGSGGVWVEEQRDELSCRRLVGLCERALELLGDDEPVLAGLLRVRLAAERAYDRGDVDAVASAVDDVRALGDDAATAEALSLYHHTLLGPAHASERRRVADELLDVSARAGGSIYALFGLCWRTVDLYLAGDHRAERSFAELRERADALASRSIGYIADVIDVMRTIRCGDLTDAERRANEALATGEQVGDADALAYYGGHLLGIRWAQGRLSELRPLVETVIDSASLRRRDRVYLALWAYALAVDGDHDRARAVLDELRGEGLASIPSFSTGLATLAVLAETAFALTDAALAAEVVELLAPFADIPVMPSLAVICLGPTERFLGIAYLTAGRLDDAVACFRRALRATYRLGNRPAEALLHADLADALRRRAASGDAGEASRHLATAIELGERFALTVRVEMWRAASEFTSGQVAGVAGTLERDDTHWRVAIDGRSALVEDVVGMRYVAVLVAQPDTDVLATDLSAAVTGAAAPTAREAPALDAAARRDYRRRLDELEHELERADRCGDAERSRRAALERAALVDRLRRDSGLGGRMRRLADDTERCRGRVSKAIRRALDRVEAADPVLGRALALRIRTGHVCRYESDPSHPIVWTVRTAD